MNNENTEVICNLADKDIVSSQLLELVCGPMLIRRYESAVCNDRVKSGGKR